MAINPFCILNWIVGLSAIVGGTGAFLVRNALWTSFILAVFVIVFGIVIIMSELGKLPGFAKENMSFLANQDGRGAFYILLGCMFLGSTELQLITGFLTIFLGIVYWAAALFGKEFAGATGSGGE
eukprot:PLAT7371.1.p4 GENE.PLAT7371.1~~PLAT7371.1.p4  ORF type:complete len:125 (-),score=58.85 PLAT7371.1:112-486(-)